MVVVARAAALVALLVGVSGAAVAREGVDVGPPSRISELVSAEDVERSAEQQYAQLIAQVSAKRALAGPSHPQLVRLRAISQRIIPHAYEWNERARQWRWEVNLIGSDQINAFCMPGGKIAFFTGILEKLKLTDDEVAMVMGHEMAHALREHAREQMGKNAATRTGLSVLSSALGLGSVGRTALGLTGDLLSLHYGREDETEADLVGLELAARAGYDPQASISLWQKMATSSTGSGAPAFISTHPARETRIRDLEANIPKVQGLYERAEKPARRFAPME